MFFHIDFFLLFLQSLSWHVLLNQSSRTFCVSNRNIYKLWVGVIQIFMGAKHHHCAGVFHVINIQWYSLSELVLGDTIASHPMLPPVADENKWYCAARNLGLGGRWDAVNNFSETICNTLFCCYLYIVRPHAEGNVLMCLVNSQLK